MSAAVTFTGGAIVAASDGHVFLPCVVRCGGVDTRLIIGITAGTVEPDPVDLAERAGAVLVAMDGFAQRQASPAEMELALTILQARVDVEEGRDA